MDNKDDLLLVCPAEDWKGATTLGGLSRYQIAQKIAEGCGLKVTERDGKLYIDRPVTAPLVVEQKLTGGLVYPSGIMLERHPDNNAARYAPARSAAPPLVKGDWSTKISKHFALGEFRPHDDSYTGVRVHPDLVSALDTIRVRAGSAIRVTSGYRPPAYNAAVGGVSNSFHVDGFAADIYCDTLATAKLHAICEAVIADSGGVGYYPSQGFVHVDVRGYRSRWTE